MPVAESHGMSTPNVTHHARGAALAVWLAAGAMACAGTGTPVEPGSATGDPGVVAAAQAFCVDAVNQLRASVGDPPLARSARIDTFSTEAAHVDGEAHVAHKYFLETNGGPGVASAENVIEWWKVSDWGSIQMIVRKGIDQMWAEGPSGHHYVTMRGKYTEMGCGIAVINGEVTVSQDFH
jgi:hypothetical protein